VHDALRRDVLGAGPLEPLLRLPGVTDVVVNGTAGVFVDVGHGLKPAEIAFADDASVRRLAQRLAALGGRRLDDASPFVDVRLADGSRCHALLAPIARPGTLISLRVSRTRGFTIADLVDSGMLSQSAARLLRALVRRRAAFVISGGTGSGKTTLLAALLTLADPASASCGRGLPRAASRPPALVWLEAGRPTSRAPVEVTVRTLVRQALRMRPDRLVVGEVRGGEVVDLLAALNTGTRWLRHAPRQLRRDVRPGRGAGPGSGPGAGRGAQPARRGRRRRGPPRHRRRWPPAAARGGRPREVR
jgi:pilus assembly protein CpaF